MACEEETVVKLYTKEIQNKNQNIRDRKSELANRCEGPKLGAGFRFLATSPEEVVEGMTVICPDV
jgi:hypothetical protein